jgi:hypothetical protein
MDLTFVTCPRCHRVMVDKIISHDDRSGELCPFFDTMDEET